MHIIKKNISLTPPKSFLKIKKFPACVNPLLLCTLPEPVAVLVHVNPGLSHPPAVTGTADDVRAVPLVAVAHEQRVERRTHAASVGYLARPLLLRRELNLRADVARLLFVRCQMHIRPDVACFLFVWLKLKLRSDVARFLFVRCQMNIRSDVARFLLVWRKLEQRSVVACVLFVRCQIKLKSDFARPLLVRRELNLRSGK